jgi:hypothetical protein
VDDREAVTNAKRASLAFAAIMVTFLGLTILTIELSPSPAPPRPSGRQLARAEVNFAKMLHRGR